MIQTYHLLDGGQIIASSPGRVRPAAPGGEPVRL